MKKILLASLISIYSLNAYELNFNKSFSKHIVPDVLTTNILISYENKDSSIVQDKIEEFNTFFKEQNEITKINGFYQISPLYINKNNKKIFFAYNGKLNYTIQSNDSKRLDDFISELLSLKKDLSEKKLKLNISNIKWQVTEKLKESAIDVLRKESIQWIDTYKNTISASCIIKSINIDNNKFYDITHNYSKIYTNNTSSLSSLSPKSIPIPLTQNNVMLKLNIYYNLECK